MGGDCLNYGCVPSKALIAAGKQAYAKDHTRQYGVQEVKPTVDYAAAKDHVHRRDRNDCPRRQRQERFEGLGVNVIQEFGALYFSRPKCRLAIP